MKGKVYVKIPGDGLGNCLLVWAHALVFARMNNLDLIVGRWGKFRPGPLFRREKKSRLYLGYFKETSIVKLVFFRLATFFVEKVFDPEIERMNSKDRIFIFTKRAPDDDLFKRLVPHKELIRSEIIKMLRPAMYEILLKCEDPQIAIHVRRGDFKIGNPITPEDFFIDAIETIRGNYGKDLCVSVFTDGKESEINRILAIENTHLSQNKHDIIDILQMSNSSFIVLSRSSSFGYWAAFLSEATIIMSQNDWQKEIRPASGDYKEVRV